MDFRRILLEDNIENVQKALYELESTEENYDRLCEFYTECEVKGITLKPENIQVIIDYVVDYRLKYSNHNEIPENYEENLSERLKYLEEVVCDYLNGNFENSIEEIVVLKCVARVMRPLIHSNKKCDNSNESENREVLLHKVPWHRVQFLLCIFIAVKSDRKRVQFKFIDDYFQLLVHEDLIRDVLQLLLNCLRTNSFDDEKWKQFYNTYSILQMYYLLLKAAYYCEILSAKDDINDRSALRSLQVIGECCLKMGKLPYEQFDDTASIYPLCDIKLFSTELSRERNKLSHFQKLLTEKQKEVLAESKPLDTTRIVYFIADMIQLVRNEIEKIVVVEYKNLIENEKVEKLLKIVKGLTTSELNEIPHAQLHSMAKEVAFISECGLADNITSILLHEISILMKSSHIKVKNSNVFSFIKWINQSSEQPTKCIIDKLKTISLKPFTNILTLVTILIEILPDSVKARNIEIFDFFMKTKEHFLTHPHYSLIREDSIIEEFIEKIRGCISNQKDKEIFSKIEHILLKKRSLCLEFRIFKDIESITSEWPKDNEKQKVTGRCLDSYNDPLNLFVDNSNISDYNKVDDFLKRISLKNRKEIRERVQKDISKDLTDSLENIFRNCGKNEIADEIYLLDCFEILKQMEIEQTQDYNYSDFDCSIPVARNMRNFLAHGDLYLEIFCPNLKEIVQSHFKIISNSYKNMKRIGFWREDDFDKVRRDLRKHRKWAREAWQTLNSFNNLQKMEDIETFRVRDQNNLSVVHYNLMNRNPENKFLMYLIAKFTGNPHFETNLLFEKLLEESSNRNCNYKINLTEESENTWEVIRRHNLLYSKTVEFFIDKFLDEQELQEKRRLLCIVLCFSCQNLNIFQEVYSPHLQAMDLLRYSIANNQVEITNFLLEQIKRGAHFAKILKLAVKNKCELLVSKVIDRISDDPVRHAINWSKLVISAAKVGNCEILDLLSENINSLNSETRNLLIKTIINCNSSTRICKFVVETYLLPISQDESELFLHLSCFDERYHILRYLLEEVIPDSHWNEIKKIILVSCFNINSLEIVEYLIKEGAYLDFRSLNDFLPFFESSEIVEVIFKHFGTLTHPDKFKKLTFVRNQNVAEFLHNRGYSFEWFEIDSLSLEFVLGKNPEPKFNTDQLKNFFRRNSFQTVDLLLKYLKNHNIQFSFMDLPAFVADLKIRKKKWLSEIDWKEPTQKDFDDIISEAIIHKQLDYVRMSLRKCKKLNIHLDFESKVMHAITYNQKQILNLLHEFGVDFNAKHYGMTYLDIAIEEGRGAITDTMRILSNYGVKCRYDIDFYNLKPQDLLLFGLLRGNLDLIQEALDLGADINFRYKEYRFGTVLHITAYNDYWRESEIRDLILKSGIDTSLRNIDNCTAFDLDQIYDHKKKIRIDHNQTTPFNLFNAGARLDDIDLMEEALSRGANVNSVIFELERNSVLHMSALDGQLKIVKFLLNNGADPLLTNKLDQYPIETSIFHDNCDIFKILISENLNLDYYFRRAAENNSVDIVRFLLEKGVDVNTKIRKESSALEFACTFSDNKGLKLAEVLIKHKIIVTESDVGLAWNAKNYDLVKLTLYKVKNYPKTVQKFEIALENGLNINLAPDSDLRTYLHLACYFQDKETVKYLLENGSNILKPDLNRKDSLNIARETNSEITKLFFQPLIVKFYSMWSNFPSEEFFDFCNFGLELDLDYIIVYWFDMILRVSGLLDNDDIESLSSFEFFASGLLNNNINYIEMALESGIDTNQYLSEVFEFVSNNESDVSTEYKSDSVKNDCNIVENLNDLKALLTHSIDSEEFAKKAKESLTALIMSADKIRTKETVYPIFPS